MDEYGYYFQAIVGLQSGKHLACELLIRRTKNLELPVSQLTPSFFMENLEALTNKKIDTIRGLSEQRNQWVFLNFSRCEISHLSFNLCRKRLSKLLQHTQIVIEVTECGANYNTEVFKKNLAILKNNGFQIAVDDFGVGSSDIESLKLLDPEFVKLDISLIRKATLSEVNAIKFYQLVDLIRHRGHKVVIEGIETKKELLIAKKTRAEFAQGYIFHKPEPVELGSVLY